jgi:hypothetical protein
VKNGLRWVIVAGLGRAAICGRQLSYRQLTGWFSAEADAQRLCDTINATDRDHGANVSQHVTRDKWEVVYTPLCVRPVGRCQWHRERVGESSAPSTNGTGSVGQVDAPSTATAPAHSTSTLGGAR